MAELITYRIDSKDRIDFFNEEFVAAAKMTDMGDPSGFFGTPIWDFFADEATAELYRTVYERVRSTRGSANLAFRSDAPDSRRSIQMQLKWLNNDGIEHACRVGLEEKRPPLLLFDSRAPRSESFVKLCSWCGQVQIYPQWIEAEEACRLLMGPPGHPLPQLTHGLCPVCSDRYAVQRRLAA